MSAPTLGCGSCSASRSCAGSIPCTAGGAWWGLKPSRIARWSRSQWLVWKFEQKEGDKKPRKVPYYATGRRRVGEQGTPEDRAKLCVLDEAWWGLFAPAQETAHGMSGVGFRVSAW
jgi:hypothetical protein